MALSKVAQDLTNMLTCGMCLDDFTKRDPRVLHCVHSFCLICLESLYRTAIKHNPRNTGSIICPTCNSMTRLPRGSVHTLRSYFIAGQVADTLKHLEYAQQDDGVCCTKCKQQPDIVSYCFDCVHIMCINCRRYHDKKHKQHINVAINRHNIRSLKCRLHSCLAEDFCMDCKLVACTLCHSSAHRGHAFASFTLPSKTLEKVYEKSQNPAFVDLASLRQHIDKEVEITEAHIDLHTTQIITTITDKATAMKRDLRSSFDDVQQKMKQSEAMKKNMASRDLSPELIMHPLRDIPGLSLDCDEPMMGDWVMTTASSRYQPLQFVPDKAFEETLHLGWLIPGQAASSAAVSTVADINIKDLEDKSVHDEIPAISIGTATAMWDKQDVKFCSVEFMRDGNIIAVGKGREGDNQLYLYDIDGNEWPVPFNTTRLGSVGKLAVHQSSYTIALMPSNHNRSWNNKTKITLINTKESTWIVTSTYVDFEPMDLAFDSEGQLVYLTSDYLLVKHSRDGKEIWREEIDPQVIPHLKVAEDDRIFLQYKSMVSVYNPGGNHLGCLPRREDRHRVTHLNGFCIDSKGNIYIVDSSSSYDTLRMFDTRGRYIKDVIDDLEKSESVGIDLALHEDRHLIAVGYYDRCTCTTLFKFNDDDDMQM